MDNNKKRTANFSHHEKSLLSELVLKYKNIIENKRTDATTNSQKAVGWSRLADEFNSVSTECYRTPNNLKTCWENVKRATKKQVSNHKKEIFMTGGGKPQPPPGTEIKIVEAVLGPALEGLSNIYDCDAPDSIEIVTNTIEEEEAISQAGCSVKQTEETPIPEEEKENNEDPNKLWDKWTPKTLKRPITESLRFNNSEENWLKRRRPKNDSSQDVFWKEKIDLVKTLKRNAEEEGKYRILILKEQLRQEQIKTEKLLKTD